MPIQGGTRSRPAVRTALGAVCTSPMAIVVTLAGVGPVTTVVYRCGLALPVLGGLAVAEQRRCGSRSPASRGLAVLAGLFLAVDLVLFNHAIADLGAGIATVLGNLSAVCVAALAWALLGERPGRRYLLMLPVVLTGMVLVSGLAGGSGTGPNPAAGVGYAIAVNAAYACFLFVLRQSAGGTAHVAGQLFDATAGATAGAVLLGLAFGGLRLAVSGPSLGWLLLLALLVQTAGWLLITSSLPGLPAAVSSLLLLVQPALALVLAAVVLGQQPTLIQLAGAVLVCSGALLVARARRD